jgi:hypothetical protein
MLIGIDARYGFRRQRRGIGVYIYKIRVWTNEISALTVKRVEFSPADSSECGIALQNWSEA